MLFELKPGTTTTTVTTSVTTVSADDESSGLLSSAERSIIRKTWDQAKKDWRTVMSPPRFFSGISLFTC